MNEELIELYNLAQAVKKELTEEIQRLKEVRCRTEQLICQLDEKRASIAQKRNV